MLSLWKLHSASAKSMASIGCYYFSTNFDSENPYTVLGVKATDSDSHIKAAYRALSKKYHPDLNRDPRAVEILKKVNSAYDKIKHSPLHNRTQHHRTSYSWSQKQESQSNWGKSTNYEDTNWYEDFIKQSQRNKQQQNSQKTREKPKEKPKENEKAKSSKKDSKADSKAESDFFSQGERDEYAGMTDEDIYFRIFRKTYNEDPTFYYKSENLHLRRKYEAILEKRKGFGGAKAEAKYDSQYYENYSKEDDFKSNEKDEEPQKESGFLFVIPALSFAAIALALYYYILKQSNDSTTSIDSKHRSKPVLEIEKVRQFALKADEEKKKKAKEEYIGTLATMKKYPRTNPDAVSMLIDYTIWTDLKLYSIPHHYYYEHIDSSFGRKQFQTSQIHNLRPNTKLNLALEAERVLKNIYVPVNLVLEDLKEKGFYDPPVVCMRFWGFIMIKIRKKPIIAENLQESISKKEDYISLFDLFWRYSTPILLANYDDYVFPIRSTRFIPDTTTREGMPWLGFVTLNHRVLPKKVVKKNEKNIFMWQGKANSDQSESDYIGYWGNFYETMKTIQH